MGSRRGSVMITNPLRPIPSDATIRRNTPPTRTGGVPACQPSAGAADEVDPTVSKTRRKHAMLALQDLGETLTELRPDRLAALALPERLAEAYSNCTQADVATKRDAGRCSSLVG